MPDLNSLAAGAMQFANPQNPFVTALGISQQRAQNDLMRNAANFAPKMSAQDLARAQIQNQLLGTQAKYADPQLAAQVANSQLQNQLLGAQVPFASDMQKAQLQMLLMQTAMMPLTARGNFYRGLSAIINSTRPGAGLTGFTDTTKSALEQAMANKQPAVGAIPVVNTGDLYKNLIGYAGAEMGIPMTVGTDGLGTTPVDENGVKLTPLPVNTDKVDQKLSDAAKSNQLQAVQQQQNQNVAQAQAPVAIPQDVAQATGAPNPNYISLDQYNNIVKTKRENSVAPSNLLLQANRFENATKTALSYGDPAEKFKDYMGAAGRLRFARDRALVAAGKQPSPEYNDYMTFKKTLHLLQGQITQAFGDSVSPSIQDEMKYALNPITWDSSPESGQKHWDALMHLLKTEGDTSAKSVGRVAQYNDLWKGTRYEDKGSANKSNQETSQIPKFKSQDEFLTWAKTQPLSVLQSIGV
ncbi:hypothetical protein E6Q11_01840 [Candidatus Dojkabacteria bacterium]|uniref:Uncharacterized protein n=1 Tax=Candidatus Dojkabacteria bacterium TaxID=2099670 RepID=A0A5C7JAK8_9BACT|nr:MAG: hypothetical protein E6Q11_01840 [Candidatus Dojkabacteria bacterium]